MGLETVWLEVGLRIATFVGTLPPVMVEYMPHLVLDHGFLGERDAELDLLQGSAEGRLGCHVLQHCDSRSCRLPAGNAPLTVVQIFQT